MTAGPIPCAYCGKTFIDDVARWTHTKAKHHGKKNPRPDVLRDRDRARDARKNHREDDDESFADRAVQAEIDRACGVDNPDIDWLLP